MSSWGCLRQALPHLRGRGDGAVRETVSEAAKDTTRETVTGGATVGGDTVRERPHLVLEKPTCLNGTGTQPLSQRLAPDMRGGGWRQRRACGCGGRTASRSFSWGFNSLVNIQQGFQ